MHSNLIENYKKELKLNKTQRQIIVGLILGDGHLETQDKGRTYRLKVEYSEKQKKYIDWLWRMFKPWIRTSPKLKIHRGQGVGLIRSLYFNTYSHGSLRFYGKQFYNQEGKKIIPRIIKKLLTPFALAIWFMDDGSWKSKNHRTYVIAVNGYNKKDLILIQRALEYKFGIEISLHKQYNRWRIYVQTTSAQKFKDLIEKYVISSMKYKLGNNFA